jgi:hypothetical protein
MLCSAGYETQRAIVLGYIYIYTHIFKITKKWHLFEQKMCCCKFFLPEKCRLSNFFTFYEHLTDENPELLFEDGSKNSD